MVPHSWSVATSTFSPLALLHSTSVLLQCHFFSGSWKLTSFVDLSASSLYQLFVHQVLTVCASRQRSILAGGKLQGHMSKDWIWKSYSKSELSVVCGEMRMLGGRYNNDFRTKVSDANIPTCVPTTTSV